MRGRDDHTMEYDMDSPEARYHAARYQAGPENPLMEGIEYEEDIRSSDVLLGVGLKVGVAAVLALMIYALLTGDTRKLMAMPDAEGAYCGVTASVRGLPFIYYPLDPSGKSREPQLLMNSGVCVASCPKVEEVGRPIAVPMTQREEDPLNPKASSLTIHYMVQSPKYATRPFSNNLCLPLDQTIRKQVYRHLSSRARQVQTALGTLERGWPIVVRDLCMGALLVLLATQLAMPAVPRISLYALMAVGMLSNIVLGIYAVWWAKVWAWDLPGDFANVYGESTTAMTLLGVVALAQGVIYGFSLNANFGVVYEGFSVYKSCLVVLSDLGKNQAVVVAFLAVFLILGGIATTASLRAVASWNWLVTTVDEGGWWRQVTYRNAPVATPLYTEVLTFSWLGCFAIVVLLVTAWMITLAVRAVVRWGGAYLGLVWYYQDPLACGCDQRVIPLMDSVKALTGALTTSLGSNFLYGLAMPGMDFLTRHFAFASRRRSPGLTPADGDDLSAAFVTTTPAESSVLARKFARRLPGTTADLAALCDIYHACSLTENISSGADLIPASGIARSRLTKRGNLNHPVSATRYVGSFSTVRGIACWSLASFATCTSAITLSRSAIWHTVGPDAVVETKMDFFAFSVPDSPYFVSNPALVAFMIGAAVYIFADLVLGFAEGAIDAVLYGYVMDIQSDEQVAALCDALNEHPSAAQRAPARLKFLLMSLLEDELGLQQETGRMLVENELGYKIVPESPLDFNSTFG